MTCTELGVEDLGTAKPIGAIIIPDDFTGKITVAYVDKNEEKIRVVYEFVDDKLLSIGYCY